MNQRGLTLVEVLVALGIFAAINAVAVGALTLAANGSRQLQEADRRISDLERFRGLMRTDLYQLVEREVLEPGAVRPRPPLVGGEALDEIIGDDGFEPLLALVRSGWSNPGALEPRAELQAVTYLARGDELVRRTRPFLDAAEETPVLDDVLLKGVSNVRISFRVRGEWEEETGRSESRLDQPLAVRMTFEHPDYGPMEHVFVIGGET